VDPETNLPDSLSADEAGLGLRLTFAEARVLGSLLEKEATTPDYYPMTLGALQAACNQKSNRDPVTEFDDATIERALEGLRDKHLAAKVHLSGSRVPKFKHTLDRVIHLDKPRSALLCVLLLRGVQTAGELNQRTERLHDFGGIAPVEDALGLMIDGPGGPLVKRFPPGAGRRVETFAHLLCGEPVGPAGEGTGSSSPERIVIEEEASWRKRLEDEVAALRAEVSELQAALERLRPLLE
jgi:uncharacterized protein YceH (UPF0502 family)